MSNVFVACEAITELTGSELAMLRALPGQGLADLSETQRQWCELQAGHGGPHVSLTQLIGAVNRTSHEVRDEWWWLRWDWLERSLAAVPTCIASVGASEAVDNGTCGLPQGHRGEHEYEFADPQLVYMDRYALTARVTEALAGEPDEPAVVFVNALGSPMTRWDLVRQRLRGRYRLITYDRAGTGESHDRPSNLRQVTYRDLADELVQLLDRLQQTGRVVLVGHSIGSLIARVAASEWPQRVAGVVHVDGWAPAPPAPPAHEPRPTATSPTSCATSSPSSGSTNRSCSSVTRLAASSPGCSSTATPTRSPASSTSTGPCHGSSPPKPTTTGETATATTRPSSTRPPAAPRSSSSPPRNLGPPCCWSRRPATGPTLAVLEAAQADETRPVLTSARVHAAGGLLPGSGHDEQPTA